MKKYAIILLSLIGALILAQCSKRANPVDMTTQHGRYWSLFFDSPSIRGDKMQDYWNRQILVYTPPGYNPADTLKPIATGWDSIAPPRNAGLWRYYRRSACGFHYSHPARHFLCVW